jgi:hypothetical protein
MRSSDKLTINLGLPRPGSVDYSHRLAVSPYCCTTKELVRLSGYTISILVDSAALGGGAHVDYFGQDSLQFNSIRGGASTISRDNERSESVPFRAWLRGDPSRDPYSISEKTS